MYVQIQVMILLRGVPPSYGSNLGGSEIVRYHSICVLNKLIPHFTDNKIVEQCFEVYAFLLGICGAYQGDALLSLTLQVPYTYISITYLYTYVYMYIYIYIGTYIYVYI